MRMLSRLHRFINKHSNNASAKYVGQNDSKLDPCEGHKVKCPGERTVATEKGHVLDRCGVTSSLCTNALLSEASDCSSGSDATCKVLLSTPPRHYLS